MTTDIPNVDSIEKSLQTTSLDEAPNPVKDPYRSFLSPDTEKDTVWRHGGPPIYKDVNKVFESGRTQVWKDGSLERIVENLVKTWEMELSHKPRVQDHKTIDPSKFTFAVNGGPKLTAEEALSVGSYNALLASTLPGGHENYKAKLESFESSHELFRAVFPDGFAFEILAVYSGPPVVAFKYRHWGVMKGGFKGHEATGEVAESFGVCIATVDEKLVITSLEVFYDPSEFLGALTKGPKSAKYGEYKKGMEGCPFLAVSPSGQVVH